MRLTSCQLPRGLVDAFGAVHREAVLRPLSGSEEELLADPDGGTVPQRVSRVLSRCVQRIGSVEPLSQEEARQLLVGDRQCLLLALRCATFGPRVWGTVWCPWPDCGRQVDIEFSLQDLPVREAAWLKNEPLEVSLSAEAAWQDESGGAHRCVGVRLPTGADQEALCHLDRENGAEALQRLLERCVVRIGPCSRPGPEDIARLSPLARMEIEQAMERAAPGPDLLLQGDCPECGREFPIPFDLQDFFFGEVRTSCDLLYREVHYLAFNYHWSEEEIMGMSRERRRRYIEVLADAIDKINEASA